MLAAMPIYSFRDSPDGFSPLYFSTHLVVHVRIAEPQQSLTPPPASSFVSFLLYLKWTAGSTPTTVLTFGEVFVYK